MLWPFRPTAKFCGRAIDLNLHDRLERSGPGELNELAYKFGMPNHTIAQWSIVDNPQYQDAYCAVIQAMAEITTTARQRADEDFPLGDEGEYVLPTEQQAAAGLGRIVVREPAVGSAYMRLSLAVRRWRIGVSGKGPRARYHRQHTGRRVGPGQRRRMRQMRMMMMEEEGGTGGPTTTAPEEDGAGDGGGDGGGPDPVAARCATTSSERGSKARGWARRMRGCLLTANAEARNTTTSTSGASARRLPWMTGGLGAVRGPERTRTPAAARTC